MGEIHADAAVMKKQITVQVEEKPSGVSSSESSSMASDWETGRLRRFPVGGAAALFFVLCCSTAALLILWNINGRLASEWSPYLQPNVCLSITNGLSTLAIAYAVANGIAIAWWRRAMLGASIKELHYTWAFSASVSSILLKIKYFNVIALAALAAKVAIVDGVLYQRSLSAAVVQDINGQNSSLSSFFMNHLPTTGIMPRGVESSGTLDYTFAWNVWYWSRAGNGVVHRDSSSIEGCDAAACTFNITGAGLGAECVQKLITNSYVTDAKAGRNVTGELTVFSVDMKMLYPDSAKNFSRIQLSALWPMTEDATVPTVPTTFRSAVCELRPALVKYNMLFTNPSSLGRGEKPASGSPRAGYDYVGLSDGKGCEVAADPFTYKYDDIPPAMCSPNATTCNNQVAGVSATFSPKYDIYEPFTAGANSTLLGIYQILADHFNSSTTTAYYDKEFHTVEKGEFASLSNWANHTERRGGSFSYRDPIETIMNRLNTLTMIIGSDRSSYPEGYSENGTEVFTQHDIPCLKYWKDKEYVIAHAYMWSAFGLTFVVIFLILPVYWGYWQLGRDVTLGPMEIAYAFQGPAFATANSQSGHADHIVKAVGRQKIQYGAVDETNKKLAFKSTSSAV